MKNQTKLYNAGLKPVYKIVSKDDQEIKPWKRVPCQLKYSYDEDEMIFSLKWNLLFTSDASTITYIAYTFPYSYQEMTTKLDELE